MSDTAANTHMPVSDGSTPPQRLYAEQPASVDGNVTLDGTFVSSNDEQYYGSPYFVSHKNSVQPFPPARGNGIMTLDSVLPAAEISKIIASNQIVFHIVGDTGALTLTKFDDAESVSDMMAADLQPQGPASFFYHLGDVVYSFGEEQYYYEQFYEEYRNYNAPIFAIPGNHDGMIYNDTSTSLQAFLENFCAASPGKAPAAGNLVRTTMDQPGVYFTLDAPFVSIIGLYSNILDGSPGGLISSLNNKFPTVTDVQTDFLKKELLRLSQLRQIDGRAILFAVHHPLFSGDSKNGGSPLMAQELTGIFQAAGVWPDAIFSGHAHNYQRFSWNAGGKQIPCIIAGSGGYNATPIESVPKFPYPIVGRNDLIMENYFPDYGYLLLTLDHGKRSLTIDFNTPKTATQPTQRKADTVTVNW